MATATPPVAVPPLPALPTANAADDETVQRLLKTGKTFAAGMFAGLCECVVGHPLDTVKVRMQTGGGLSMLETARSTLRKEGPRAFYRGVESRMVGLGLTNSVLFGVNGECKRWLHADPTKPFGGAFVASAAITGLVEALVYTPVDLLKTRMQVQYGREVKATTWSTAQDIMRTRGVRGLYHGFVPTVGREIVGNVIYFCVYESTKRRLTALAGKDRPSSLIIGFSGGFAGTVYWAACFPIDTWKSVVQASDFNGPRATEVARQLWQTQGVRGFYRGLTPTLLRAFPTYATTFTAFEFAMRTLDPHGDHGPMEH